MGEWKEQLLEEVMTLKRGYDLAATKRLPGTVPIVTSSGFGETHNEAMAQPPGVVTGRYGTIGQVFFVTVPYWPLNTTLYVKDFKGNDERFIYYFLKTFDFEKFNDKSTIPGINRNHLYTELVRIPNSLPEQRAIASVLSSLDAKIDLLHRQNKTLEAMAEALFRQWFVEGADEEAADGTLADVAVNIRDGVPVNAFNADDRYVALEHIDRRCIALEQFGSSADVASNKYRFGVNDILFGKLRPYFHKVCLTSFAGICSTDILVIRPKRPELLYYCLFAFFQDEVVEYANAGSGGTRMPRTNWSDLSKYPIALPGKEKLEAFNKVVKPMMEKLQANMPQIRSLTALRDTLLPKLMSGEVSVELPIAN